MYASHKCIIESQTNFTWEFERFFYFKVIQNEFRTAIDSIWNLMTISRFQFGMLHAQFKCLRAIFHCILFFTTCKNANEFV